MFDSQKGFALQSLSSLDAVACPSPARRRWWQTTWATSALLLSILLLGTYFRTLSLLDWDLGTGQHPDERFFTDVSSLTRLPANLNEYFDAARAPSNPRNVGKTFFVYGTFPTILTRFGAVSLTPSSALPENVPGRSVLAPDGTGQTVPNPERKLFRLNLLQKLFNPEGRNYTDYSNIYRIGRSLATIFDLASILVIFLIGQRLYGRRVGLIAAFFAASAVMSIQQSHFFVDPTFSTCFALLALYWAIRIAQGDGWGAYVWLGISIGFAMANRLPLATLGLVGMVAAVLGALAWAKTSFEDQSYLHKALDRFLRHDLPFLFLAGFLTVITFRIVQPYAFIGSLSDSPQIPSENPSSPSWMRGLGFFDLRLDPRFVQNMDEIKRLVSGESDFPPSQQWVRRAVYLFPLQNMVLWGMGPALGLTVWLGWLLAGWLYTRYWLFGLGHKYPKSTLTLFNPTLLAPIVLWVWIGFYFLWQGGQFVKSIRYMLPIYGALFVFGAWALVLLWDWSRAKQVFKGPFHTLQVRLTTHIAPLALGIVLLGTLSWAYAFTRIYTRPHSRIIAARWLLQNAPSGSKIASEQWDDGLPIGVDGGNPWGSSYQGVETHPYGEDDPQKYFGNGRDKGLLDSLDEVDYVTLTSNRVYGSTERLPMRYPALRRYYHYLFSGELGFELVADVNSYPTFFGIPILDQSSEEAFTVYDHPRILIFHKTANYSRQQANQLLTKDVNWDEVYKSTVFFADRNANALRLTESQWPKYRAGGTWAEFFDAENPVNLANLPLARFLAPLWWFFILEVIGLAAFCLLFYTFPWLPDRGMSLARPLGLLFIAYSAWILGSLHWLPFSPGTVWLCALPLLLLGFGVGWRSRFELQTFWQTRKRTIITAESLYIVAFLFVLYLRWLNPDLWHPARGGEKPMELAYLNAVLKSAAFPPYDPWFAGGHINYYYFGFVIVGVLIHLTGILPQIAYNLAVPTLFALVAVGSWGIIYNLLAPKQHLSAVSQRSERFAQISALLAPVFVLILGNLAQAIWFLDGYATKNQGRPEWAFWDATRIVAGTVNEFPFFTFLFADLHAHMIVMPFSLAILGLSVSLIRQETSVKPRNPSFLARYFPISLHLFLFGLLAGTLQVTNTWDYPTFVGLVALTLALLGWWHFWREQRQNATFTLQLKLLAIGRTLFTVIAQVVIVFSIGRILFLPFIQNFATESSGIDFLREGLASSPFQQVLFAQRTSVVDSLRLIGLWLFLLSGTGFFLALRFTKLRIITLSSVMGGMIALTLIGALTNLPALIMLFPLFIAVLWLLWHMRYTSLKAILPMIWALTALGISLGVEIVVVKGDIGRMNTVFKFGLHAWILFALSAAIALPWVWVKTAKFIRAKTNDLPALSLIWSWRGGLILLLAGSFVYPFTATPARIGDRYKANLPNTLDGMAFMPFVGGNENGKDFLLSEDAAAILWLQKNVKGTPVILEAHLPSYRWAGRIATFTGLPTLFGWEWHQIQQRNSVNASPIINRRATVIEQIFNGTDINGALEAIKRYGIEYIFVGGVEHAVYNSTGLSKFATLVNQEELQIVFTNGQTQIYQVKKPGKPTMLTSDLAMTTPHLRTPPPLVLNKHVNELPAVKEYDWNDIVNSQVWLAILVWLLTLAILLLLGLPLAVLAFGQNRDAGLVWAKLIGLLILGYCVWLPTSLGLWRYDRWALALSFLFILAFNSILITWLGEKTFSFQSFKRGLSILKERILAKSQEILLSEGLFLFGFACFAVIRAFNPDLWHPIWGGEKPMEFGFLNAILRSPVMPPYDPFFSDGYINYYYYGLYLVSLPIKATGIAPAFAFNLVIPTLFALTLAGGYAIVAELTGKKRYGLLGAAFLTVLGNLASVFPAHWARGILPIFEALSRKGLASLGRELGDWFMGPSRIIPNTINEFPFWGFLYGDLHPHLIALPITLLVIALAYQIIRLDKAQTTRFFVYGLISLALGTLAVTNSWDFPTYALLVGMTLVGGAWREWRWSKLALLRASEKPIVIKSILPAFQPAADILEYSQDTSVKYAIEKQNPHQRERKVWYAILLPGFLLAFGSIIAYFIRAIRASWTQKPSLPRYLSWAIGLLMGAFSGGFALFKWQQRHLPSTKTAEIRSFQSAPAEVAPEPFAPAEVAPEPSSVVPLSKAFSLSSLFSKELLFNGARLIWALGEAVLWTIALAIGGLILYTPFFEKYYATVSGVGIVSNGTKIQDYFLIYGLFLVILLPFTFGTFWNFLAPHIRRSQSEFSRHFTLASRGIALALFLILISLAIWQPVFALHFGLGLLLILSITLILQKALSPAIWFILALLTLVWAVSLGIDFIYIRDHLDGSDNYRMNTVFKFGMQIWTLLALAAAASLAHLMRKLHRIGGFTAQAAGLGILTILILATSVFLFAGIPSRVANRFDPSMKLTLDGLAFLQNADFNYDCQSYGSCEPGVSSVKIDLRPDALAIAWLNKQIEGTPIIVQSDLWFYRAYGIRIAANTGLPTVISALHENEQRDATLTGIRDRDVDSLFRTPNTDLALRILAKYRVNYVYVGSVERAFYNAAGLAKFEKTLASYLQKIYDASGVKIYKVQSIPSTYAEPEPYNFTTEKPLQPQAPAPAANNSSQDSAELTDLEAKVAQNPTYGPLVYKLADLYRSQNRLDDAARVLSVATQANPADLALHHLWGDILAQAGRYDEAEQAFLQATKASPSAGNWNKLGSNLLKWGKTAKAEVALLQAITLDAKEPEPHFWLGQIYKEKGDKEQAQRELETYLRLAPDGFLQAEAQKLLTNLKNP